LLTSPCPDATLPHESRSGPHRDAAACRLSLPCLHGVRAQQTMAAS
jgi:hypothetical protein